MAPRGVTQMSPCRFALTWRGLEPVCVNVTVTVFASPVSIHERNEQSRQ